MDTSRPVRHVTPAATVPRLGPPVPTTATTSPSDAPAATPTATTCVRQGRPRSTVDHVADFYGAYIDALHDIGRGVLADALRRHYLTPELQRRLTRWEAVHHQDGVLRTENVPTAWEAAYNDSGMGHCWSRVTLTRQESATSAHRIRLLIRSDLATRLISDIRAAD
ncbi:hypothetical protein [Streptomyces umbrinus]|uniref:hypothetical protein n=1 Tax=Streptomyces umbrinus TaxID=67370 RepID=UPI001679BA43|nr:hypothetical protein [Streptomyces umbrinus]GHB32039.1 hypothetical protein GCM10010306_026520 [Streptomyces umbrinus]